MQRRSISLVLCVLAGCTGEISISPGPDSNPAPTNPSRPIGAPLCNRALSTVAPLGTRLVRLTHRQYDNSVRDLLGLDVKPSQAFQSDPTFRGFDNSATGLLVGDRLGRDYRRAAEDLAQLLVQTPAALTRVVTCDKTQATCPAEFVQRFGRLAWRRPLKAAEQSRLVSLFAKGAELIEGTHDTFTKGVQVVVEALLQSPHFLYREEVSEEQPQTDVAPLSQYELAARLSYLLWNSTPSPELLDLAANGRLGTPEELAAQAKLMLDDSRARAVIDSFHHQWLELDRYENLMRDRALYPAFTDSVPALMQEETRRFVTDVVLDQRAPFEKLFNASHTFVNRDLAALYGVGGQHDADRFDRVELDPTKRRGLLTQLGFLASHAYMRTDSPIHRGVFVIRKVLCQQIPDPPGNANLNLPPKTGDIKTTRQQVAAHTSPDACAGCHNRINPIGFGFGNYDAVGQHRTTENGEPIDATGELLLSGKMEKFGSGVELSDVIARSEEARNCYATQWVRYAYQRDEEEADGCTIEDLRTALARPDFSVRDMIAQLTAERAFRFRAVEEVQP